MGRLLAELNLQCSHIKNVAMGLCYFWRFKKQALDDYLKGAKDGYLAPMIMSTAPETPSSPAQPDAVLAEGSDGSLAMSEEDGDDGIVSSIESPFPAPQEAPRVGFFDPRARRWSETVTGMQQHPLFAFSKVST